MFSISKNFSVKYPEAHAGILVIQDVRNPQFHVELENRKREIEMDLRTRFSGSDPHQLAAVPPLPAYTAFYKGFDKTYHVLGQLNSIVYKEKSIPSVAALVEAMFMAELKNGMLTAGHDLDQVCLPITLNIASGEEHFIVMRGVDQALKPGDMFISDSKGILSSVIYGPDQRTQITAQTTGMFSSQFMPPGMWIPPLWKTI